MATNGIDEIKRKINFLDRYFLLVEKFCGELKLDKELYETAKMLSKEYYEQGLCSSKPSCVAGASVMIACHLHSVRISQRRIARVSNICDVSLRRAYKDLAQLVRNKNLKNV